MQNIPLKFWVFFQFIRLVFGDTLPTVFQLDRLSYHVGIL